MEWILAWGRNYDPVEDLELAHAWDRVTSDASVGTDQNADKYWTRVKDEMENSSAYCKIPGGYLA
ncbi:hypothetical protein GN958_ATG00647 [Phytophthora infestans]|uniref:Uncharacterized protein n=1 Tax=Phytophthora infestans TaxID=4787 RepID=A0A8S9VG33_PHYIN|nr:hypothetical protein GN958_ATG00647 [Phytophthora infestans]